MKTDWEAAINAFKEHCYEREWLQCVAMLDGAIRAHTRRTEEDLPKNAWHWVKGPGDREWTLAYFNSGRDITYVFTLKGYRLDYEWYWEHRLELEIGPEIVPPGEEYETVPS